MLANDINVGSVTFGLNRVKMLLLCMLDQWILSALLNGSELSSIVLITPVFTTNWHEQGLIDPNLMITTPLGLNE